MEDKSKQNITFSIISIIVLILLVVTLTYAFFFFFVANVEGLNVVTNFVDSVFPVFSAVPDGNLELNVGTVDMLEEFSNTSKSSFQTINVSLIGGTASYEATCYFNFSWTDTGDKYYPTPLAENNNLKEYTIKITDSNQNIVFEETNVSKLTSGDSLLSTPQSISSSGTLNSKIYTVTATIYNLNIAQTIYSQTFASTVTVNNVEC